MNNLKEELQNNDKSGVIFSDDKIIIGSLSNLMLPILLIFGLYIQFYGENSPGGGFQAGIIFGTILIIYALVHGIRAAKNFVSSNLAARFSVSGVLIYFTTGFICMLNGNMFEYTAFINHSAANKIGIFFVELGVFISVFGSVTTIFYSLVHYLKKKNKFNI